MFYMELMGILHSCYICNGDGFSVSTKYLIPFRSNFIANAYESSDTSSPIIIAKWILFPEANLYKLASLENDLTISFVILPSIILTTIAP
jgi:hypothetical protein